MDACYMAKRARELLPELPKGVTPSYIHYLDIIQRLESQNIKVKISDIRDQNGQRYGSQRISPEILI